MAGLEEVIVAIHDAQGISTTSRRRLLRHAVVAVVSLQPGGAAASGAGGGSGRGTEGCQTLLEEALATVARAAGHHGRMPVPRRWPGYAPPGTVAASSHREWGPCRKVATS
jgi:hypothetical protein